jgi:hypothetical protein
MTKKPRRLRTIVGGPATTGRTLILEVRAFADPTTAMHASVKALSGHSGRAEWSGWLPRASCWPISACIRSGSSAKERPESVAAPARVMGRTAKSVKADLGAAHPHGCRPLGEPLGRQVLVRARRDPDL